MKLLQFLISKKVLIQFIFNLDPRLLSIDAIIDVGLDSFQSAEPHWLDIVLSEAGRRQGTVARRSSSSLPADELNILSISSRETPAVSGTARIDQRHAAKHASANTKYVPLLCCEPWIFAVTSNKVYLAEISSIAGVTSPIRTRIKPVRRGQYGTYYLRTVV